MCDLVMCLLSMMLCACSSHLGPNFACGSIVKQDVDAGMKMVRKCFPLLTQALFSVSSLCGIRAALLSSCPAQSVASGLP